MTTWTRPAVTRNLFFGGCYAVAAFVVVVVVVGPKRSP